MQEEKMKYKAGLLLFLLSAVVLVFNLANGTIQKPSEAVSEVKPLRTSTPAKIILNNEPKGTAADTSILVKSLKDVFTNREENAVFKKNSFEIEKKVFLTGERSVLAEDYIKVFSAVSKAGAAPVAIPLKAKKTIIKPNPLVLMVSVGEKESIESLGFDNGMEISFVGQIRQNDNKSPLGETAILIVADTAGGYTLNGRKFLPNALKTEIQNRFRSKPKDRKIIFAEVGSTANYGFLEEIAQIASDAAAAKVYFVTQNSSFKEKDISFSVSQAWFKDDDVDNESGPVLVFRGPDESRLTIDLSDELLEEDPSGEIKREYESLLKAKVKYKELRMLEIGGVPGLLKVDGDDSGWIGWQGFRKKNGKFQFVSISLSSPKNEFNHRRYELLNILHSIKFADS
jgi:biopolymer transport protein ExbD